MATSYSQLKQALSGGQGLQTGTTRSGKISSYSQLRQAIGEDVLSQSRKQLEEANKRQQKIDNFNRVKSEAERYAQEAEKAQTFRSKAGEFVFGGGLKQMLTGGTTETISDVSFQPKIDRQIQNTINDQSKAIIELSKRNKSETNPEIKKRREQTIANLLEEQKKTTEQVGGKIKDKTTLQLIGQSLATATELTPTLGFKSLGTATIKTLLRGAGKEGVKELAKGGGKQLIKDAIAEGALFTGIAGAGEKAREEGATAGDIAKTGAISALGGGLLAGGLGIAGAGLGKLSGKLASRTLFKNTVKNIEKEVGKLDIDEIADIQRQIDEGVSEKDILKDIKEAKEIPTEAPKPKEVKKEIPKKPEAPKEEVKTKDTLTQGEGKYKSATKKGIVEVEGTPVKIHDDIDTFIHKDENGNWVVSEKTTGKSLNEGGGFPTQKHAIDDAKEAVDFYGVDKMKKIIDSKKQLPKTEIKKVNKPEVKSEVKKKSEFAKRLNEDLPDEFKINEDYDVKRIKGEVDEAANLIEKDLKKAIKIASGTEKADGNTQTAVSIMLAEKAKREGDWETVAQLYNSRRISNTRRGQEIAMEKASVKLNPEEEYMKQVVDARLKGTKIGSQEISDALNRKPKSERVMEKVKKQTKELKESLNQSVKFERANKVFNDLICK